MNTKLSKPMMTAVGLFLVGTLVACDQYISNWAQSQPVSGKRYPPLEGYEADSFAAFMKCDRVSGTVVTQSNGEKRRCRAFTGLSFDIYSTGEKMDADIVGLCEFNRPLAVAQCAVRNGIAEIKSVTLGEYYPNNKLCQSTLKKGRASLGYSYRKSVVLDYGVEAKDLNAMSQYTLSGFVLWGIYERRKSRQNPEKISRFYVGDELERFTCSVDKGEVSKIAYSEVGELTWNEKGRLNHHEFFDN